MKTIYKPELVKRQGPTCDSTVTETTTSTECNFCSATCNPCDDACSFLVTHCYSIYSSFSIKANAPVTVSISPTTTTSSTTIWSTATTTKTETATATPESSSLTICSDSVKYHKDLAMGLGVSGYGLATLGVLGWLMFWKLKKSRNN